MLRGAVADGLGPYEGHYYRCERSGLGRNDSPSHDVAARTVISIMRSATVLVSCSGVGIGGLGTGIEA
jgi:hypothetical protein